MFLANFDGLAVVINGFAVLLEILVDDSYVINCRCGFDAIFS